MTIFYFLIHSFKSLKSQKCLSLNRGESKLICKFFDHNEICRALSLSWWHFWPLNYTMYSFKIDFKLYETIDLLQVTHTCCAVCLPGLDSFQSNSKIICFEHLGVKNGNKVNSSKPSHQDCHNCESHYAIESKGLFLVPSVYWPNQIFWGINNFESCFILSSCIALQNVQFAFSNHFVLFFLLFSERCRSSGLNWLTTTSLAWTRKGME